MMRSVFEAVFGGSGGLTWRRLRKLADRERFSDALPWIAYDGESKLYLLQDDTCGFIWECSPLYFAGEATVRTLEGLFNLEIPEESVVQFILHADPHIDPILDLHMQTRVREDDLVSRVTEETAAFLATAVKGIPRVGVPVRNFRAFFTIKFPIRSIGRLNLPQLWSTISETLRGAGLGPRPMTASALVEWSRRLLNGYPSANPGAYDPDIPIRSQVLLGSRVEKGFSRLKIDTKFFRCLTPKSFPRAISPRVINEIFGGVSGVGSDPQQMKTPFFFTLSVLMHNQKNRIHTKCNFTLRQEAVGSLGPTLQRKKEEYLWAVEEVERGAKFLRMIPALWVYDDDEWNVTESLARARRIWEGHNFVMQEDKGILVPLFIASLPFGLYNDGNNVDLLSRDFIVPMDTASAAIPFQGDFGGFGLPVCPFIGRKGQLFGVDVYDGGATNHNAFVAAGSGGGKSFLINSIVYHYYSTGAKIRIIDIGGSYKKMTRLFGARFIDFSDSADVCMNPFTNVVDPEHDIPVIAPIIAQMAFFTGTVPPNDTEMQLIRQGVRWAYDTEGTAAGVDSVHRYLSRFGEEGGVESAEVRAAAEKLAFNLYDYTSEGAYGRFFNGPATFDISADDFVVLELEHLKTKPELFRVVTMQVINAVTQDLYLSDRSQRRMIFFDEAYQFLGQSSHMRGVIEEGYRRARKYGGSFWVITQSIIDARLFGNVGDVILNNSAFKFYLASDDFEKAKNDRLIDYDDFTLGLLKSVRSPVPLYSEVFMDTPFGVGIGRLVTDPFSYYVFTSKAGEVAEIDALVDGGMSYAEAIETMVARHRG